MRSRSLSSLGPSLYACVEATNEKKSPVGSSLLRDLTSASALTTTAPSGIPYLASKVREHFGTRETAFQHTSSELNRSALRRRFASLRGTIALAHIAEMLR